MEEQLSANRLQGFQTDIMWLARGERAARLHNRLCTLREIRLIHGFIGSLRHISPPLVIADHFTIAPPLQPPMPPPRGLG